MAIASTGLFNVMKNIQHINITDLHGRDLISEVDILGNEITLHPAGYVD